MFRYHMKFYVGDFTKCCQADSWCFLGRDACVRWMFPDISRGQVVKNGLPNRTATYHKIHNSNPRRRCGENLRSLSCHFAGRGARISTAHVGLCVPQKEAVLLLLYRTLLDLIGRTGQPLPPEDGKRSCGLERLKMKITPAINSYVGVYRPGSKG